MSTEPRDETPVTPLQEVLCELLAARHRLGHNVWTLTRNGPVLLALKALERLDLVAFKSGVVADTFLAWLTDRGRAEYMAEGYIAPILGGQP